MPAALKEVEWERLVLQALCQEQHGMWLRDAARKLLGVYAWREPAHQIVYRCLMDLPANSALALREQMAGCATRKGFPDVEWEDYFRPSDISAEEAETLIRRLSGGGGGSRA